MKTVVMIPTYNERENIGNIIRDILSLKIKNLEISVIDDKSPDGTGSIVKRMANKDNRIHLVLRNGKKGRGFAGIDGYKYCLEKGADIIIEMDADFSHEPKYIPDMIKKIKSADVVLGSRYVDGGKQIGRSIFRRALTYLANFYISKVLDLKIKDCNSGFRCFRRYVIEDILKTKLISSGPSIVQEVLYRCHKKGYSIAEVPIVFSERKEGASKLQMKHLLAGYLLVLRMRFSN